MNTLRALFAILLLATPALAQPVPYLQRSAVLASTFDLDGEAADADQVVASATLADSTSYTIAANPDVCRLVDVTITDADSSITAGVLTVVGTDCWGAPLTTSFTFAAGGSGVKTLVVGNNPDGTLGKASGAYYSTITTVSNGALTGEGVGDALTVGYTANSAKGWPMYGRAVSQPNGRRHIDIFGKYDVNVLVTNGAATTDIAAVSASTTAPFENVSAGDILVFNVSGVIHERKVVTRTDADNVIVNAGVTIPAAGVNFAYRKLFFFGDPVDGWFNVNGFDAVSFVVQVDANANTGGVVSSIECGTRTTEGPITAVDLVFEEDTATVASAATGTDTTTIDLRLKPHYTECRASIKFGTGDDADAAAEDVDIVVGLRK